MGAHEDEQYGNTHGGHTNLTLHCYTVFV